MMRLRHTGQVGFALPSSLLHPRALLTEGAPGLSHSMRMRLATVLGQPPRSRRWEAIASEPFIISPVKESCATGDTVAANVNQAAGRVPSVDVLQTEIALN